MIIFNTILFKKSNDYFLLQKQYLPNIPGGNKKLHALTVLVSGCLLFLPTLLQLVAAPSSGGTWLSSVLPWSILIAIAVVSNFLFAIVGYSL